MTIHRNRIAALGVAGAIAIAFAVSAGPAFAAPVSTSTAALKQVDLSNVVDAQWRRRRNAAPFIAGTALAIIGGAIAADMYRGSYYDGYAYDDSYAYQPYAYGAPYGTPYAYGAPYGTQRYYRGYGPYAPSTDCVNRPESC